MANQFIESFGHFSTTALLGVKGWVTAGTNIGTATPRFSGAQYLILGNGGLATKVVTADATYTVGFGLYIPNATDASSIVGFLDTGTIQVDLRFNVAGQLFVTRNGTTIVGPAAGALLSNTWYFVEFQSTINDTTGTVTVKVNGTTVLSGSGLDTKNTANASANQIRLYGSSTNHNFADVYANSGTGGDTGFWDDIRVAVSFPDADGTTLQWTNSTGSTSYDLLDETSPNTTDYISSATANQITTLSMQNLAAGVGAIKALAVTLYMSKDDAGTRTGGAVVRSGGTNYVGATFSFLDTWSFVQTLWTTDPATSAAWTESGVNAVEAGVKLIS